MFISQKHLLMTDYEQLFFHGYGNTDDKYVFIVVPGLRPDNVPGFRYIESDTGEAFLPLSIVQDTNFNAVETVTIDEYLRTFTKRKTTVYVKKKPLRIEEDSIDEVPLQPIIESSRSIDSDVLLIDLVKKSKTRKNRPVKQMSLKRSIG